jgi:hypothetical protein
MMAAGPMNTRLEAANTLHEVETTQLDLRYESCRLKQAGLEERLLGSIAQRGIAEPLEGVEVEEKPVLLNGFKRYRCARKLGIGAVPYRSLGQDEAAGIIQLLRTANDHALGILEQAAFLDELKSARNLSVAQIAAELSRSKAWVSLRLGLLGQMSATVRQKLFSGAFPVYSYMYTLRSFMRLNGDAKEVDEFVMAVSGQRLSVREIELLARGYFRGPDALRAEIRQGNLALPLERMKAAPAGAAGCSELETGMLRDLEVTQKYMLRVMSKGGDERLASRAFHAQAQLLTAGILSREAGFLRSVRRLNDRGGQA